jgi:hypothetical protein
LSTNSTPELMQASAMELLRLYEQGGFEIDPEFRDLPDHVAARVPVPA